MDPSSEVPPGFQEVGIEKADLQQGEAGAIDERCSLSAGDIKIQGEDEASRLRALATDVRDQDDLERDIGRQVSGFEGI